MPAAVECLIFDLDGLLIDTECLCLEVAEQVISSYGGKLTPAAQVAALGKRPLDCWRDLCAVLELTQTPEQLLEESNALLHGKWREVRPLPGALRLLRYTAQHGLPLAVATSTPRACMEAKLSRLPELRELLPITVCGEEVPQGKPHPDIFLAAAAQLGIDPSRCLVFEDAPSGVQAATAAGMRVVVVPSFPDLSVYPAADPESSTGVVAVLPSLMLFQPQLFGLPPVDGLVGGIIPVEPPIAIVGTVVKGFGRGSKELGIPTANVDSTSLAKTLGHTVTGIYAGWASVGTDPAVYKMVMSIGWNPFYGNKEKTAEPWILHDFEKPFYGEEIRLLLCGYVRPEANFTSLQNLIDEIHNDGRVAHEALEMEPFASLKHSPVLKPSASDGTIASS